MLDFHLLLSILCILCTACSGFIPQLAREGLFKITHLRAEKVGPVDYGCLSRSELQSLAKANSLKANAKSSVLVDQLKMLNVSPVRVYA